MNLGLILVAIDCQLIVYCILCVISYDPLRNKQQIVRLNYCLIEVIDLYAKLQIPYLVPTRDIGKSKGYKGWVVSETLDPLKDN